MGLWIGLVVTAKYKEPIENITTYKPFSIKELTVDIFNEREVKVQSHIKELESKGMQWNLSAYWQPSNTWAGVKVRFDDSGSDRGSSVPWSRFWFGSSKRDESEVGSVDLRYDDDRRSRDWDLKMAKPSLGLYKGRDDGLPPRASSRQPAWRPVGLSLNKNPSVNSNSKPLDLSSDMSDYKRDPWWDRDWSNERDYYKDARKPDPRLGSRDRRDEWKDRDDKSKDRYEKEYDWYGKTKELYDTLDSWNTKEIRIVKDRDEYRPSSRDPWSQKEWDWERELELER